MSTSQQDIRTLLTSGKVLLAPMAGITDAPFRAICKRMGAALTYTEMVSAKGLHYNPDTRISRELLTLAPEETPCAVQIYGADAAMMAAQAARIVGQLGDKVALIDINMGCPMQKVVSRGEGCALMRTPEAAAAIVREVAASCGIPVTVKFRKGWDEGNVNTVEFAQAMEDAGASAVAVHGRTRSQFYREKADWDAIASVKDAVTIPVIGSGDIFSASDVLAMLKTTGVDAVMIARGAQGNPWIFRQARTLIETGEECGLPTAGERLDMACEHAAALIAFGGELAFIKMRKHVAWYLTGLPGAKSIRDRANELSRYGDLCELLSEYREQLEAAATFLGSRCAFYNPGQPLPEIFRGSHQPSLF
ncbi:MAG: tRNA dihydrouridine synthase DusB [Nitrospirales bacterium]|nr:tRNA dihydrouridine synthase DusB [Nitrospirales bacterium]